MQPFRLPKQARRLHHKLFLDTDTDRRNWPKTVCQKRSTVTQIRQPRREFLKKSVLIAAAGSTTPYSSWTQRAFANTSPNDRPMIGCIGLGGMGTTDAREHAQLADIAAVCDVDSRRSEAAKQDPKIGRGKADAYADYRKVLDRKDIDVVSISTCDHWHVKIAIEALQAGKHVFCQKPLTLTLEENQLVRNACKKYKDRVFIVGTQRRTESGLFVRAVNMVQKGLLGDIRKVTVGVNGCPSGGPFPKVTPPKQLDWNMWLGQTPKVDYIEQRCHYKFRWWYEYSGGKLTDWGAHFIDIATWALQQDRQGMGPIEIDGADATHPVPFKDGYPTVDNCYNTSSNFAVKCQFADGIEMIATSRGDAGILFEGTKGRIFVDLAQDYRQADRGKVGRGQVRSGRLGAPVQRKTVRGPQAKFLPLHSRRRTARLRRFQPRSNDEYLPSLCDCRAAGPDNPVGPEGREDHPRRSGRRFLRPNATPRI